MVYLPFMFAKINVMYSMCLLIMTKIMLPFTHLINVRHPYHQSNSLKARIKLLIRLSIINKVLFIWCCATVGGNNA